MSSDLPEGQQSKSDPRSEAARRESAIRTIINERDRAIDEVDALRARVAYLENELDEERASAASIRAAYDVLAMAGKASESVPVRSDRVWWVHDCGGREGWFSHAMEASEVPPVNCPSCCNHAGDWYKAAKVVHPIDRLLEE